MSGTVFGATKHLKCKDLHGYLKTLPGAVLSKLYNHPATCMAVFRELPCLSKHFVMRLLFVEQPVPQTVVSSWITSKNSDDLIAPLETLSGLRILQEHQLTSGLKGWVLNNTFRFNLGTAMLGGGQAWTGTGSALGADKHAKDISFLDQKAMERWECLLHFMVGSKEGTEGVSQDIVQILLSADLMKLEAGGTEPLITPGGFQFLLMDTSSQVWYFMLQYLDTVQSRGMDLVECLSFLFQLSFSTLGKDYSTEGMNDSQQRFLQHLREFGLVYQRKRKSQRYYPTRLAINLASGLKETRADTSRPGYIVVETNYRVYAYTDSPLQVALLGLFCEMRYRFPNLSVAVVTRDSVREALCRGITAEQIISFLRTHAHSEMLQMTPILPPTITDQIRLWELERDRFKFTEGVMYNQFLSQSDFELLRDYARDLGVLTWDNPSRRVMIVTRGGHDEVKRFWKRQRHNNASS